MHKRKRLHVRWAESDATLVASAARKLDMPVSELVRRAAVNAAVDVLRSGAVPPRTEAAQHS
jgi:uncharacterized protein (DUF1778 family)